MQNQEVKPVASGFRAGRLLILCIPHGLEDTFLAALEFLISKGAYRGVGPGGAEAKIEPFLTLEKAALTLEISRIGSAKLPNGQG